MRAFYCLIPLIALAGCGGSGGSSSSTQEPASGSYTAVGTTKGQQNFIGQSGFGVTVDSTGLHGTLPDGTVLSGFSGPNWSVGEIAGTDVFVITEAPQNKQWVLHPTNNG